MGDGALTEAEHAAHDRRQHMVRDVQLPEAAAELLRVADLVTANWMRRIVLDIAVPAGVVSDRLIAELDGMVGRETERLLDSLAELLATDVDEQRTNPLSLYRDAVGGPTGLLRAHGVAPPSEDPFASAHFPDDVYRLGPASWSEIDPDLLDPGLVWGAWKAMTILRRRRDDGVR